MRAGCCDRRFPVIKLERVRQPSRTFRFFIEVPSKRLFSTGSEGALLVARPRAWPVGATNPAEGWGVAARSGILWTECQNGSKISRKIRSPEGGRDQETRRGAWALGGAEGESFADAAQPPGVDASRADLKKMCVAVLWVHIGADAGVEAQ
jgi:hypothetical protein